jgi:hypothetical protein
LDTPKLGTSAGRALPGFSGRPRADLGASGASLFSPLFLFCRPSFTKFYVVAQVCMLHILARDEPKYDASMIHVSCLPSDRVRTANDSDTDYLLPSGLSELTATVTHETCKLHKLLSIPSSEVAAPKRKSMNPAPV